MTAAASLDGGLLFSIALNNAMKTTPPEFTVTYTVGQETLRFACASLSTSDMVYNLLSIHENLLLLMKGENHESY